MIEKAAGTPAVVDAHDVAALTAAVVASRPELVIHQLTDLPDDVADIPAWAAANSRMRAEGTANLLAAALAAGGAQMLAQSIAWAPSGRGAAVKWHEAAVLDAGGIVVRYAQLYGPGPYYEADLPAHPRIHVSDAALRTVPLVKAASGVVVLADPEG